MLYCFLLQTELATVPAKILETWADNGFPIPGKDFEYKSPGRPMPYEELNLDQSLEKFDIEHELTRKGIEAWWRALRI